MNHNYNFVRNAWIASGLIFLTLSGNVRADVIDDYLKAQMQWQRIPGLSVAVVRDGKIIKARGYGVANVETGTPATAKTVYKIGSVSKQFIAAAIMLLVDAAKLGLDDPLSKYLTDVPESWKAVTIRHLLTHTSGLVRDSPAFDPLKNISDAEVIKGTYSSPLRFVAGQNWAYSNVNYYCLAEVIKKVTGKPWSQFIVEQIFARVGMTATRTTTVTELVPNRAAGYETKAGSVVNAEFWLALRPSGAFLSSVLDLAKWDASLYGDAILTSTTRDAMWSPVRLNDGKTYPYGFGWFLDSTQNHRRVYHSGGLPGFVCEFDRFIDDGLTIILMANIGNRDLEDMARKVAAFYAPALKLQSEKAVPDNDPQVTATIKAIMADLAKDKLDKTVFTSELATNLDGLLKTGTFNALVGFGPLRNLTLIERKIDGTNRAYRYRLTYRNIILFVDCTFERDFKISKFGLHD